MSTPTIQPYLFFGGRCQEALDFYAAAVGAKVDFVMRHKDSPEAPPPGMLAADWADKIMHVSFHIGGSPLMASDGCEPGAKFDGFSLALSFPTAAEAEKAFAALADGGQVKMPLAKTFWSPCFGMLTDRFGIGWMVSVPGAMG